MKKVELRRSILSRNMRRWMFPWWSWRRYCPWYFEIGREDPIPH